MTHILRELGALDTIETILERFPDTTTSRVLDVYYLRCPLSIGREGPREELFITR